MFEIYFTTHLFCSLNFNSMQKTHKKRLLEILSAYVYAYINVPHVCKNLKGERRDERETKLRRNWGRYGGEGNTLFKGAQSRRHISRDQMKKIRRHSIT